MDKELTSISYLAGLVDADGCIQIMRRKNQGKSHFSVRLSVSQVSEQIPIWIMRNFGGRLDRFVVSKERRQPIYRWQCESLKAKEVLTLIEPYLILKKERALLALKFQSTIGFRGFSDKITHEVFELRESIFKEMKILNSKKSRSYWTNLNMEVN